MLDVRASQAAQLDPHRLAEIELGTQLSDCVVDADFLESDRVGLADIDSVAVGRALDQRLVNRIDVRTYHVGGWTGTLDLAVVQPDRALAHHLHGRQVVRHEQDCAAAIAKRQHLANRAVLECDVAHRQHFVDEQDVGIHVRCHGESEPRVHARRVALQRRVDIRPEVGKVDDLVEARLHFASRQAQDDAVEKDVLAAGELRVEAGPEVDQRSQAAFGPHVTAGRSGDACQQFEDGRLARAVVADQPDGLARRQPQADVAQRPQLIFRPPPPEQPRSFTNRVPLGNAIKLHGRIRCWAHRGRLTVR